MTTRALSLAVASVLVLWTALGGAAYAQATTVEVWIQSSIPSRHDTNPGCVRPVPNSPGLAMTPGSLPGVSDCFLTDSRWLRRRSRRIRTGGARVPTGHGDAAKGGRGWRANPAGSAFAVYSRSVAWDGETEGAPFHAEAELCPWTRRHFLVDLRWRAKDNRAVLRLAQVPVVQAAGLGSGP